MLGPRTNSYLQGHTRFFLVPFFEGDFVAGVHTPAPRGDQEKAVCPGVDGNYTGGWSAPGTHKGPPGEGSSHGWDEKGGGQDPGVNSPQATTFWLKTSKRPRILDLNMNFWVVTKVRIEHISFTSLSAGFITSKYLDIRYMGLHLYSPQTTQKY